MRCTYCNKIMWPWQKKADLRISGLMTHHLGCVPEVEKSRKRLEDGLRKLPPKELSDLLDSFCCGSAKGSF